jgi:hypothetical protein
MTEQGTNDPLPIDKDWRNRLLDPGKHAESVFLNQLNFFLIFESLLLGSAINGILVCHQSSEKLVLIGITIFGFFLTLF